MAISTSSKANEHVDIQRCADLILSAEAELHAFMQAVDHIYGEAAAQLAGSYWVNELESMKDFASQPIPDWRRLTIAAARRMKEALPLCDRRGEPAQHRVL